MIVGSQLDHRAVQASCPVVYQRLKLIAMNQDTKQKDPHNRIALGATSLLLSLGILLVCN
jgi:hypothetical protein